MLTVKQLNLEVMGEFSVIKDKDEKLRTYQELKDK